MGPSVPFRAVRLVTSTSLQHDQDIHGNPAKRAAMLIPALYSFALATGLGCIRGTVPPFLTWFFGLGASANDKTDGRVNNYLVAAEHLPLSNRRPRTRPSLRETSFSKRKWQRTKATQNCGRKKTTERGYPMGPLHRIRGTTAVYSTVYGRFEGRGSRFKPICRLCSLFRECTDRADPAGHTRSCHRCLFLAKKRQTPQRLVLIGAPCMALAGHAAARDDRHFGPSTHQPPT